MKEPCLRPARLPDGFTFVSSVSAMAPGNIPRIPLPAVSNWSQEDNGRTSKKLNTLQNEKLKY